MQDRGTVTAERLRKLAWRTDGRDFVFTEGCVICRGRLVIEEIAATGGGDYEIYVSRAGGDRDEVYLWKRLHLPPDIFRSEEYDSGAVFGDETPD